MYCVTCVACELPVDIISQLIDKTAGCVPIVTILSQGKVL